MKEYNDLTTYKQEDFLEYEIIKYLQKTGKLYQPFMNRLSFALTSLNKARLIYHPKRGITVLTEAGKAIDVNNYKYIHKLVIQGWNR